jgi:epoxyqueuosine reductase
MEDRLRRLAAVLVAQGAALAHYYVDTGPLLDRAIAQRAGLGWCGRHSCLITKAFGTWVVLGEILTDLALQPDPPASGDCGLCWNCMNGTDACPTGAIVEPGVVDARKCISYWTIEHRGWIPREVRPILQDMIFGCDLCQEACPFNRLAQPASHPEFYPRPETGTHPLLLPLLNISEAEYQRRFRRSAIKRAKRGGLRRNVAIAMGNLGDERAAPELVVALRDPDDPVVRGHAAWALGRIGGDAARAALGAALATESDPRVLDEIDAALA